MRTGLWVAKCAVAVLIMATVTSAMAQGQGGGRRGNRGGGGGFGVNPLTVIQNDKVQSDLVLSADQKSQVTKLAEEAMAQGGGRRGGGGAGGAGGAGGGAAAFQAARDEQMKKINEVLLQPQQDRFAQILLQLQGTATALNDAKVADKLGLTSDQKSKLEALRTDYQAKIREARMNGAGGGGGFGAPNPEVTKLTSEENDKAKELLTADQQKQYDSMLGKKIDIDPATLRGGGRGRRGQAAQPNA